LLGPGDLVDAARRYGTPLYVYDYDLVEERLKLAYRLLSRHKGESAAAFSPAAAPIADLLGFLAEREAWFRASTGGELGLLERSGARPGKVFFEGPGKAEWEIRLAVSRRVYAVHVDTLSELADVAREAASQGVVQRVGVEVNTGAAYRGRPGGFNTRLWKRGVEPQPLLDAAGGVPELGSLELIGLSAPLAPAPDPAPYVSAAAVLLDVAAKLEVEGVRVEYLDLGPLPGRPEDAARVVNAVIDVVGETAPDMGLVVDPSLLVVGDAAAIVARVVGVKRLHGRRWALLDASVTDYPAILFTRGRLEAACLTCGGRPERLYNLAGPLPESFDVMGSYSLPELREGDLVALWGVGAYGWGMSGNYRFRPRPPVVRFHMGSERVVVVRETVEDMLSRQLIHG